MFNGKRSTSFSSHNFWLNQFSKVSIILYTVALNNTIVNKYFLTQSSADCHIDFELHLYIKVAHVL